MHVTLVHIHVLAEHRDAFIEASRANHAASVQEAGNLRFDILQSPDDPDYFIFYEAFRSSAAAAAHKTTTHYQAWRDSVAEWMAEPRRGTPMIGLYPAG
jgi:autoinducer 2-degrading protein